MTYELAKKLKDAGFPQKKGGMYISSSGIVKDVAVDMMVETEQAYCVPTLSELIEACGDEFSNLIKFHITSERWSANCYKNDLNCSGETPEEAVANLWLKLNEKA